MHKAREHQQPLYMFFVDFKKAFDSISHHKLWPWVTMMDMSIIVTQGQSLWWEIESNAFLKSTKNI